MDYPQQHIKPYDEEGKKTEQVERMFDNIAHAYDKLNPVSYTHLTLPTILLV